MLILVFLMYFSLSCFLPVNKAPDEYMRYVIPEYIYTHHSLPVGTDMEIIDETWGFSYGFTPYLPSILAAGVMQITAIFNDSARALIIASRFVSVLAATASVWLAFRLGEKLLFRSRFFAVCIGLLPQFIFLAAYLNNDAFAVFTAMLIFYAWLYGKENHWNYKSCLFLAVGIAICALTYYNAYGWVLCSVFYYFGSIWMDKSIEKKWSYAITHGCVIAGVVALLAGWFFIRNAILYQGDILGMDTMYACAEEYGYGSYKPSSRILYANEGLSVLDMLRQTGWIRSTIESFFAVFGYMELKVASVVYGIYGIISLVGVAGFFCGICKKKADATELLLYGCCFLCIVIPFILSIRYSYAIDYQAQGRYVMSMLPAYALFLTKGYQWLDEISNRKQRYVSGMVSIVWCVLAAYIFVTVMLPGLYLGI